MRQRRSSHELRCTFCSRQPLLATYGLDEGGRPYVHMRVYKQNRIFGEMIATSGTVHLRCRECFRWHRVIIRTPQRLELKEESPTAALPPEPHDPPLLAPPAPTT